MDRLTIARGWMPREAASEERAGGGAEASSAHPDGAESDWQGGPMTLEMRSRCERCGAALAFDAEAYVCSYECTFCPACTALMDHVCPNCGGELVRRPRRAANGGDGVGSAAPSCAAGGPAGA